MELWRSELLTNSFAENVKTVEDLRCTIAGLIGENERLRAALKVIEIKSQLPEESVDLIPVTALYEINLHAKEALK
ncbi:hypothetical protein P9E08_08890 [Bacillus mojavensis]|uniref:hypothetical protein n=1 Tax=Bacillus mojavensis TaxID=72360 RepID=UPI002DB91A71|nr:hypothetical protein [Bacillus mojavensis]MEC1625495.1 hypothetical protein [Bacillus mojavensis]